MALSLKHYPSPENQGRPTSLLGVCCHVHPTFVVYMHVCKVLKDPECSCSPMYIERACLFEGGSEASLLCPPACSTMIETQNSDHLDDEHARTGSQNDCRDAPGCQVYSHGQFAGAN